MRNVQKVNTGGGIGHPLQRGQKYKIVPNESVVFSEIEQLFLR